MAGNGAVVDALEVSDKLRIPMSEIHMTAVRSQGAGGQNVNKVATAIHLRFDIRNCTVLKESLRTRLLESDDQRINSDGVLVIKSQRYRSQERNRQAALQRLADFLRDSMRQEKKRLRTMPSRRARQKRLDDKARRSALKRTRGKVDDD